MKVGDKVLLGVPAGVFTQKSGESVLISAGIGITPIMSFFRNSKKEDIKSIYAIHKSAEV